MDRILKISQGNPGALRVLQELQWFSHWDRFLDFFLKNEIVGPRIWELYKDVFHESWYDFGRAVDKAMLFGGTIEQWKEPAPQSVIKEKEVGE